MFLFWKGYSTQVDSFLKSPKDWIPVTDQFASVLLWVLEMNKDVLKALRGNFLAKVSQPNLSCYKASSQNRGTGKERRDGDLKKKKINLRFLWKDRQPILQSIWISSSVSLEKAAESALLLAEDIMKDLSTGCKILCAVPGNLYLSKWCLSIPQIQEITLEESALTPVLSTSSLCTGNTYILQPCSAHSSSQ